MILRRLSLLDLRRELQEPSMREIISFAWKRLTIISTIIGDVQGRVIATVFYFTILLPFGLGSRATSDRLNTRTSFESTDWTDREPISTDLDAAKQQG